MKRALHATVALLAALLLGACATGYGNGNGYGDPYYGGNSNGYGYPSEPTYPGGYGNQYGSQRFIATVEGVDPQGRLLLTTVDSRGYAGSRIEVYFDNSTRLYYQGQQYPVTGLERGDEVSVDAVQSNGRLWARQIEVVRNVRDSGGYRY